MARKSNKAANGTGTIRKRNDGRWEGRYTIGIDQKTGKRIYKSVYASTQHEVRQKLTQIAAEVDVGDFLDPSTMRLSQWLEMWLDNYVSGSVKPYTADAYRAICKNHLIPGIGFHKLSDLSPLHIQILYNGLMRDDGLSAKTIKNIHGVLHRALGKAVKLQMIRSNPAELCDLPRVIRKEIHPMDFSDISAFLNALHGHRFERLYKVTLFTGLRQGEVLGLTWDCVDFEHSSIYINKQLQKTQHVGGSYVLVPTKNSRGRMITVAPSVLEILHAEKAWQISCEKAVGLAWDNAWNLVFTNEVGKHLCHFTIYNQFKKIVREIGLPNERFHDLRHSYAVVSLECGDDIKTVQGNLGHATSSFTLDIYGHISQKMRNQSAERMEKFIKSVSI